MYAPYLLPGASVRFVPFQATIPPPHARFARVTFWNQLQQGICERRWVLTTGRLTQCQTRRGLSKLCLAEYVETRNARLTVSLPVDDAVDNVRAGVASRIPGVLIAGKGAAIK